MRPLLHGLPRIGDPDSMRLCRFDADRLGVLHGDVVVDVTPALDDLPTVRWPVHPGDLLISNLGRLRNRVGQLAETGRRRPLRDCALQSPVANPTKIIGVPGNYGNGADDAGVLEREGLFVKAGSSLVGPSQGVELSPPGRDHEHEVALAVVIGAWCRNVSRAYALDYVAGYAVALDITVRGSEDRSLRKSSDSHTVLGPWLVTREEIDSPAGLTVWLQVNGQPRQRGNTRDLISDVPRLIEYASTFFTLYPGDILLTGTPSGAAAVVEGDTIDAGITGLGSMRVIARP